MKKYRIITNGQSCRIQYRWWGIWRLVTEEIYDCDGTFRRVVVLDTAEEAKKWVESRHNAEWKILK